MERNLNTIFRAAADFFLPSSCLGCRRRPIERFFRGGVCEACWRDLPRFEEDLCDVCDEPLGSAAAPGERTETPRCGRCLLSPPPFRRLRAAAPYRGPARDILIAFKFGGADFLAPHLAGVMAERLPPPEGMEEVTAVPATARARRRADHAAELLAAALAARLRLRFAPGRLAKTRATRRQSGLPLALRAGNVRGAFRARSGAPRAVLLVDDVATSGATARECARALAGAGARIVEVWCFARASRDDMIRDRVTGSE